MPISPELAELLKMTVANLAEPSLNQLLTICNQKDDKSFLMDLASIIILDEKSIKTELRRRIESAGADVNPTILLKVLLSMKRTHLMREHFFQKGIGGFILKREILLKFLGALIYNKKEIRRPGKIRLILGLVPYKLVVDTSRGIPIIKCDVNQPIEGDELSLADAHIESILEALRSLPKHGRLKIEIKFDDFEIRGMFLKPKKLD